MEAEILNTVGKIAGIGGLSIGVLLLIFREIIRKNIFPMLKKDHAYSLLRLIIIVVFIVALAGIGAWLYSSKEVQQARQTESKKTELIALLNSRKSDIDHRLSSLIESADDENGTFVDAMSVSDLEMTGKRLDALHNSLIDSISSDNRILENETISQIHNLGCELKIKHIAYSDLARVVSTMNPFDHGVATSNIATAKNLIDEIESLTGFLATSLN